VEEQEVTCTATAHNSVYAARERGCTCPGSEFLARRHADVMAERAERAADMLRRGRPIELVAKVLGVSDRTVYRDLVRLRSRAS
jgi:DNA invertase Pin-like site-specific DNA recombinase